MPLMIGSKNHNAPASATATASHPFLLSQAAATSSLDSLHDPWSELCMRGDFRRVIDAARPRAGLRTRAGRRTLALALWSSIAGVLAASSGAQAQGVIKNTFGDWQLRCETPAGAKNEQCALVQNVA